MKERPILMSGPLVVATLEGRKNMTRRVVPALPNGLAPQCYIGRNGERWAFTGGDRAGDPHVLLCRYGAIGDRLYVRERWAPADTMYQGHEQDVPGVIAYAADRTAIQYEATKPRPVPAWDLKSWNWDALKWRPSIHMPKWASRLTLEITEIRVERLGAITEEDARAEGVKPDYSGHVPGEDEEPDYQEHGYRDGFARLWDLINGKRLVGGQPITWAANPLVWRLTYRVVK